MKAISTFPALRGDDVIPTEPFYKLSQGRFLLEGLKNDLGFLLCAKVVIGAKIFLTANSHAFCKNTEKIENVFSLSTSLVLLKTLCMIQWLFYFISKRS